MGPQSKKAIRPMLEVLEAMHKLMKESSKNIKSLTGVCYSRVPRKQEVEKKVQALESELQRLKAKQKSEEKESEKQSQELISEIERLAEEKQSLERSQAHTTMTVEETKHYCDKLEGELNQAYNEIEAL